MGVNTTAGSKIFIGTTKAATVAADFASDTWTEITSVQSFGSFGDKAEVVKFTAVGDTRTRKMKGARDSGDMQLECGRDPFDAGQIALRAAETTSYAYNIKVVLADKSIDTDTPTTFYFKAMVNGAEVQMKGVNDVTLQAFDLAITSAIVEVPAAHAA